MSRGCEPSTSRARHGSRGCRTTTDGPGQYKAGLGSEFNLMIWSATNDISTTPSGSATYKNDAIPRRLAGRRITFVSIMSEAFLCAGSRNVITSCL